MKSGGTASKFAYTGQEHDAETGLEYYNARYYSTDIRRFTQPDTYTANIYNPQDLNAYSYVSNNPLRYTDPTGHFGISDIKTLGSLVWNAVKNTSVVKTALQVLSSTPVIQKIINNPNTQKIIDTGNKIQNNPIGGSIVKNIDNQAKMGNDGIKTLNAIKTGTNVVYQAVASNGQKYYGITNDFVRRSLEHASRFSIEKIQGLDQLSRYDARAVEQALIERDGLPNLANKINSISSNNTIYTDSIKRGAEILNTLGL